MTPPGDQEALDWEGLVTFVIKAQVLGDASRTVGLGSAFPPRPHLRLRPTPRQGRACETEQPSSWFPAPYSLIH